MQLSFYDASVMCYEQILQSTAHVLKTAKRMLRKLVLRLAISSTTGCTRR